MTSDLFSRLKTALAGRYDLLREIGSGGMATVYLAEDPKHHRKVAVKVLRPELAATLGGDRFFREIEIAAQLQHPHILPLLDSGEADGFLYYVMPFIEGQSLRERLTQKGELPVQEAGKILLEVVDAMAYAHRRGVVHRDIKPDNVLLSERHALVMDFGVAKAVSEATGRQKITTAGIALGTPAYMAPEQAAADPHVDHRADIYALGVLGYELLTGQPPFTGLTPQMVLAAHVSQAPEPITSRRPACPPALVAVLMHCLEKRPADRWQTADELLTQLEATVVHTTGVTPAETRPVAAVSAAPPPARGRRWLFAAGVVVGVLGVSILATRLARQTIPAVQIGRRLQVTLDPGLEVYPALSPDGKLLAYSAGPTPRLFVRQVDGGTAIAVAPNLPGAQVMPAWSPDGKRLLFVSTRGLELVPALGGTARLLGPGLTIGGCWSPDGREILFASNDTVYAAAIDGRSPRPVTAERLEVHSLAWSPDGKWIAYVEGNAAYVLPGSNFGNLAPSTLRVAPAGGGISVAITDDTTFNLSPAWTADGTLLFLSNREGGRDVYAVRLGRTGKPGGAPTRLTTGLNAQAISVSADGTRLAYAVFAETSNIWTIPIPSGGAVSVSQATPVTSGNQVIENFDISPDGRWLVFDSNRKGNSDIYRMPLDRSSEPEQLTFGQLDKFFPTYSPDNRDIGYHSFSEGHRQIYVIPSSGGAPVAIAPGVDDDRSPYWSHDGRSLLYQSNIGTPTQEARVVSRGAGGAWGKPELLRRNCWGFWSPAGEIVCREFPDGGLLLIGRSGDSLRTLLSITDPAHDPLPWFVSWSADGRTLYYLAASVAGEASIWSLPVAGGTPRLTVRFDDPSHPWHRFGFRVHDSRFFFTVGDLQSDVWVAELEGKK